MNEKYILKGVEPIVELSQQSVGEQLFYKLKQYEKLPAAITDAASSATYSYETIFKKSCSLAINLKKYGLTKNHVVGIYSKNNLDYILPVAACMYLGVPVTFFNSSYTPGELAHVANISKPNLIFCTKDTLENVLKCQAKFNFLEKIILIGAQSNHKYERLENLIKASESDVKNFTPTPIDIKTSTAVILYSSGTTGLPKGVILTHYNYNTALAFTRDPRFFRQRPIGESVILTFLPFFHGYGLFVLLYSIIEGQKIIMMSQFEPRLFFKSIQEFKVTNLLLVPPIATFIAKTDLVDKFNLSSIDEVRCGAAPLGGDIEEILQKRLKVDAVRQGYGMTEASMVSTLLPLAVSRIGSVGVVLPYFLAKIIDLDTGKALGPMKNGEICFKGDGIMKGYANNVEATREAIDEDGWLHTGDIGYYDESDYIYVVDRLKELIKYNAFQVSPAELEALLLTHPKIQDVGVIGLPDKISGELPFAFVVKAPNGDLTGEEVQEFVKKNLSSPKWLRGGVRFVKAIPKNPSGKILRRELLNLLPRKKSKL